MPKLQVNLTGPPFPLGNSPEAIRRAELYCIACCNLYPATALALMPRHGLEMQAATGPANMKAAERDGALEPIPMWLDPEPVIRQDYYAFEVCTYLVDIIEGAHQGCPSCTLIEKVLGSLCPRTASVDDRRLVARLIFCSGRILRVTTDYVYADDSDSEGSIFITAKMGTPIGFTVSDTNVDEIEIYTLPGRQRSSWPTIGSSIPFARRGEIYQSRIGGVVRHVTTNPGSEAGFSLIKSWLSQCVNAHASCREADSKAEHKLPKRVIEVGSDDNTAIRLYEHDDLTGTLGSYYVALSHCWGRKPLPRLTIDTLEKKKANMPWESLPKTFQDVILVARGIDVEYVWIDSLCIIQDDEQDWETEAAKMSLIYEGALMVMAATASGDSSGGCLFEREQYLEIQATIQPGEHFSIFATKSRPHDAFMSDIVMDGVDPIPPSKKLISCDYPLLSRAWCFQERLLGTRVLHFLRQEMVFECLESIECECGTLDGYGESAMRQLRQAVRLDKVPRLQDLFSREDERWRHKGSSYSNEQALPAFDEDLCNDAWLQIVETYSQRQITFPADIFPALSGLARRWSRMTGKRYLCGLWADSLLIGLMWSIVWPFQTEDEETRDEDTRELQNTYIAPSWSWASVQRQVRWPYNNVTEFFVEIDVHNSDCVYSGRDTFGRVTSGWIVVTGKVTSVLFEASDDGRTYLSRNGVRDPFSPDDKNLARELVGERLICLLYAIYPRNLGGVYVVMILGPVNVSDGSSGHTNFIPKNIKQSGEMYKRISMRSWPWDKWGRWNHDDSRPATLIIV